MKRRNASGGFTLLEMVISVALFALISLYLYGTLGNLRLSDDRHARRAEAAANRYECIEALFLDLSLSVKNSVELSDETADTATLFLRTSHSLHRRVMPYVGYRVRNGILYRFESFDKPSVAFLTTPHLVVDRIGAVRRFKVYRQGSYFLVNLMFEDGGEQLLKIRGLNQ